MGRTRDLLNIGYPYLTTPTPFKSLKILFNDRALILGCNLLQPKGVNYISPSNITASFETRLPS